MGAEEEVAEFLRRSAGTGGRISGDAYQRVPLCCYDGFLLLFIETHEMERTDQKKTGTRL